MSPTRALLLAALFCAVMSQGQGLFGDICWSPRDQSCVPVVLPAGDAEVAAADVRTIVVGAAKLVGRNGYVWMTHPTSLLPDQRSEDSAWQALDGTAGQAVSIAIDAIANVTVTDPFIGRSLPVSIARSGGRLVVTLLRPLRPGMSYEVTVTDACRSFEADRRWAECEEHCAYVRTRTIPGAAVSCSCNDSTSFEGPPTSHTFHFRTLELDARGEGGSKGSLPSSTPEAADDDAANGGIDAAPPSPALTSLGVLSVAVADESTVLVRCRAAKCTSSGSGTQHSSTHIHFKAAWSRAVLDLSPALRPWSHLLQVSYVLDGAPWRVGHDFMIRPEVALAGPRSVPLVLACLYDSIWQRMEIDENDRPGLSPGRHTLSARARYVGSCSGDDAAAFFVWTTPTVTFDVQCPPPKPADFAQRSGEDDRNAGKRTVEAFVVLALVMGVLHFGRRNSPVGVSSAGARATVVPVTVSAAQSVLRGVRSAYVYGQALRWRGGGADGTAHSYEPVEARAPEVGADAVNNVVVEVDPASGLNLEGHNH